MKTQNENNPEKPAKVTSGASVSKASERISQLEALVEELLKDDPKEEIVELKMKELEIPFTTDPVERINRVLEALHPYQTLDFEGD